MNASLPFSNHLRLLGTALHFRAVQSTKIVPGLKLNSSSQINHFIHHTHHHRYGGLRSLARSSGPPSDCETPSDKAKTFIISLGHDQSIAQGVVDAMTSSGLSGETLLSTVRTMAGRVEVGEDAGLEALIESVKQDLARSEGKQIIRFWCVPPTAWNSDKESKDENKSNIPPIKSTDSDRQTMLEQSFPVDGYEGMSLTDVAKFGTLEGASTLSEYIECACSGIMACSTCHVIVDDPWFAKVGEACEDEQDMIDLAYGPTSTSRLGCQLVLTSQLDGLIVKLPKGANNIMDHIPFED